MRLLQVALLLAQHAVDAAAHFPRLLSGFSLLGAQLLLPPPALQLHCRPRARGVPASASSERCPRWSRGWDQDWGWDGAGLPVLRARVRGGAGGILRAAEKQRSQAIAQAHRDGARGVGRSPGSDCSPRRCVRLRCTWTPGCRLRGVAAVGPARGPRPLTAPRGHCAPSGPSWAGALT